MCVPWELNPQPFALLTQCYTTEPQEYIFTYTYTRDVTRSCGTRSRKIRLVLRERDDILVKHFAVFILELHH